MCVDAEERSEMKVLPPASGPTAPIARLLDRRPVAQHEVDDLLLRIRGLVFMRGMLEERGASKLELERHRREIERLRRELAALVSGGGYDGAA
jgi:hypothetical protein